MANRIVKQVRCDDAIRILCADNSAVFFTLTCIDETGYNEIRNMWRKFRNSLMRYLRRSGEKPKYVMNYELHNPYLIKVVKDEHTVERVIHGTGRSHGWHIHGVISCFLPYERVRQLLDLSGFGRFDFRRVDSVGVSDYLTKHALKAYRGLTAREREKYQSMRLRLVNASRGLPKLDDYAWQSELIRVTAEIRNRVADQIKRDEGVKPNFLRLQQLSEICALLRLEEFCQVYILHEWLSSGASVQESLTHARGLFHVEQSPCQEKKP